MELLKRLFTRTEPTIYALFVACILSVAGAVIVHLMPEGYVQIAQKPLFPWLRLNTRPDTFWLYGVIALMAFSAATGIVCLVRDIRGSRYIEAMLHLTFILVLAAHAVSSLWSYRIPEVILPQELRQTIQLPPPERPLVMQMEKFDFTLHPSGMMQHPEATVALYDEGKVKHVRLSINNPATMRGHHLVMKNVGGYLNTIEMKLAAGTRRQIINLDLSKPAISDGVTYRLMAHDPETDRIKVLIETGSERHIEILGLESALTLGGTTWTVTSLVPSKRNAVVADLVYDPSLALMAGASTLFTLALVMQASVRLARRFRRVTTGNETAV